MKMGGGGRSVQPNRNVVKPENQPPGSQDRAKNSHWTKFTAVKRYISNLKVFSR